MILQKDIQKVNGILVEKSHPAKVFLFGSHAQGIASEDSDVDLLILEDRIVNRRKEMVRLRRALSPLRIPVDIVVQTTNQFSKLSKVPGTLFYNIAREGKVLYERH